MFDIIIIGAGPGGYETAAEAAAHGLTVGIVERDQMGGTCLNRGCIPTKALCRNAEVVNLMREAEVWGVKTGEIAFDYAPVFERKEAVVKQLREGVEMLMGAPGITAIKGEATLKDTNTVVVNGEEYQAKNIIIATGSAPRGLPIEGADLAMTSDDILAMETLPKSLCIVGGGVIGMEFAAVFSTFGVEVTVIEYCKEILPPFDKDVAKRLKTVLSKRGIKIVTSGIICDNPVLLKIFDDNKIAIATDDVAHESRTIRVDAAEDGDPMMALAKQFADEDYDVLLYDEESSKNRRGEFVANLVKESGAKGLVLFMQQFCDPEEMEYPYLKKALDDAGIPHIKLGIDQQMRDFGQASTAIQAFADVLSV